MTAETHHWFIASANTLRHAFTLAQPSTLGHTFTLGHIFTSAGRACVADAHANAESVAATTRMTGPGD